MPKRFAAYAVAAAICLLAAAPETRAGGGPPWEPIDADAEIERCYVPLKPEFDSGVTARMRNAGNDYAECLNRRVVVHTTALISEASYPRAQIEADLGTLAKTTARFHWRLYNENRACRLSCGTMYHVFGAAAVMGLFERLLREVIQQRNELQM
ncbi:hypothetical protein [Oleispirillum naphthae]|uniref:hypothetical protein n=1 Tax=Oleispirillum naphthae TaxID=2838853 RepID=UPI0030824F3D